MSRCPFCRDPNREPQLIYKRIKGQLRFELKIELKDFRKEYESILE